LRSGEKPREGWEFTRNSRRDNNGRGQKRGGKIIGGKGKNHFLQDREGGGLLGGIPKREETFIP